MPENDIQMREGASIRLAKSPFLIPGSILLGALIIGVSFVIGLSRGSAAPAANTGQQVAQSVNVKDVKTAGEPYIGDANAKVTMAFWSDFQCPFCKAFEVGGVSGIPTPAAMPDLMTKYVNAGKLKIVFKDFPFLGKDSTTAAEYGRSVWKLYPGQYFAWRTAMYVAQDAEGDQGFGDAPSIDALIKAKFPQMDDSKIQADISANKSAYDAAVQADYDEGQKMGISGTPGFIVGTALISGAQPLSAFSAAIDPLLK